MSKQENHDRHIHNKSLLCGRHGSEKPLFNGRPRGWDQQYSVEERDVIFYEVRLLSPDEVLFNEGLLEERPRTPAEKISSIVPIGKTGVVLFEHRNGHAIQIKHAIVDPDQVESVEAIWMQTVSEGTTLFESDLYRDGDLG